MGCLLIDSTECGSRTSDIGGIEDTKSKIGGTEGVEELKIFSHGDTILRTSNSNTRQIVWVLLTFPDDLYIVYLHTTNHLDQYEPESGIQSEM
jgi:hypothetical protein